MITPRLAWRANRGKRGQGGCTGDEGDTLGHTKAQGQGRAWAGGEDIDQGRRETWRSRGGVTEKWKEDGLLGLHPELLPHFGVWTLNNPSVQQVSGCT